MKNLEKLSEELITKCPCLVDSPYAEECYKLIQVARSRDLNTAWATELISVVYDMCFLFRDLEASLPEQPEIIFKDFILNATKILQLRAQNISSTTFPIPIKEEEDIDKVTSGHYGTLFSNFDHSKYYDEPEILLKQRLERNGFDIEWLKGKKVLDSGCGNGRYSYALKKLGAKEVIGLDFSEINISDANYRLGLKKLEGLRYIKDEVAPLPFQNNEFDYVFSNGVLHHTNKIDLGIQELLRVLKPNGKGFLMLIPNPGGIQWDFIEICRLLLLGIDYKFVHRIFEIMNIPANLRFLYLDHILVPINLRYTSSQIIKMLEDAGAKDIIRYQRGSDVDEQEYFESYKFSSTVWGVGLHRFQFSKK
tara:strand:- start:3161 stop:4252 length:1092 start_codon:yes stop_codon:yes gene_type:complete